MLKINFIKNKYFRFSKSLILKKLLLFALMLCSIVAFQGLHKSPAFAQVPKGCPGGEAGTPDSGACEIYAIQVNLSQSTCKGSGSTPDSIERSIILCKDRLKDQATNIYNTCKGEANPLTCIASETEKLAANTNNGTSGAGGTNGTGATITRSANSGDSNKLYSYVQIFVIVISVAGGIAIVGSLVWAGIRYATAGGDSGAISKAKTRIVFTLIALVLYLMLYSLVTWLIPSEII